MTTFNGHDRFNLVKATLCLKLKKEPCFIRNILRLLSGGMLVSVACVAVSTPAVELGDLQTPQTELQERLRGRSDCLGWYDFGKVPEGLTFEPAPEQDPLAETAGSLTGQRATRIFHGRFRGDVLDLPETGFTLSCWLKVNKLEAVDRDRYKRSVGGVMASGSGYYNGWRLLVSPGSSTVTFALGRPEGSECVSSSGFFTINQWHHVAVTWAENTLALWIDGTLRAETTMAVGYHRATTLKYFRIGECSQGTGVLDFEIADLGFFSTALAGETFEGLGNPDALLARRFAEFLQKVPLRSADGGGALRAEQERRYRRYFVPLLTLTGYDDSRAFRQAHSYTRFLVAGSYLRSGMENEAKKAFRQLAGRSSERKLRDRQVGVGLDVIKNGCRQSRCA